MKTSVGTMLGLSALLTLSQAMPAKAINKEWSAVAGFVGGVLVANAAQGRSCWRESRCRTSTVVVQQPVHTVVVEQPPVRHGYYQWQTERVWIPGCWIYEDRGCGTTYKVWQPGYYQTVQRKVWVEAAPAPCGW